MSDDDLNARAAEVEKTGVAKYTEPFWRSAIGAVGRAAGDKLTPDVMRQVLGRVDAADALYNAGKEVLASEASDFNADSERVYSEIRNSERRQYAISRGRRWIDK